MSKLYNLEYLVEISGGDQDFIAEMLNDFLNNTPVTFNQIKVEVAAMNWDGVYELVHKFIPTFDFVGAAKITELLRGAEQAAKYNCNTESIANTMIEVGDLIDKLLEEIKNDLTV